MGPWAFGSGCVWACALGARTLGAKAAGAGDVRPRPVRPGTGRAKRLPGRARRRTARGTRPRHVAGLAALDGLAALTNRRPLSRDRARRRAWWRRGRLGGGGLTQLRRGGCAGHRRHDRRSFRRLAGGPGGSRLRRRGSGRGRSCGLRRLGARDVHFAGCALGGGRLRGLLGSRLRRRRRRLGGQRPFDIGFFNRGSTGLDFQAGRLEAVQ